MGIIGVHVARVFLSPAGGVLYSSCHIMHYFNKPPKNEILITAILEMAQSSETSKKDTIEMESVRTFRDTSRQNRGHSASSRKAEEIDGNEE